MVPFLPPEHTPSHVADEMSAATVETVRAPLPILDDRLTAIVANPAFGQAFGLRASPVVGEALFRLGGIRWNVAALRSLLERVLPQEAELRRRPGRGICKPVTFEGLVKAVRSLGSYWFGIIEPPPAADRRT